jgi:hypothetical protein
MKKMYYSSFANGLHIKIKRTIKMTLLFLFTIQCTIKSFSQNNDSILYFGQFPLNQLNKKHLCNGVTCKNNDQSYLSGLDGPLESEAELLCGNGQWKIIFEDIQLNTGVGFDDPNLGSIRRSCVCDVINYINSIIQIPSGIGNGSPAIDIVFTQSFFDNSSDVLAAATPLSDSNNEGYHGGNLYDHIITGIKENPAIEDGQIRVNFAYPYFYCNENFSSCQYDFYMVLLHEFTHLLGFFSFVTDDPVYYSNNNLLKSMQGPNIFSKMDEIFGYYSESDGSCTKLVDIDLYNSNGGINPSLSMPNLLNSERIWATNDDINSSRKNHPMYSPLLEDSEYIDSPSHFDMSFFSRSHQSPGLQYRYVMNPTVSATESVREYQKMEIEWLIAMGYNVYQTVQESYNLSNNAPYILSALIDEDDDSFLNHTPIAGNNDLFYTTDCCTPITINLSDLEIYDLDNDDIFIYEPESGNDGLYNLRGCGNLGNNHDLLVLSADRKSITFNPRNNYFGISQFAFHLADQHERGSLVVITINITKGNCFINSPEESMIVNGLFEYGGEYGDYIYNSQNWVDYIFIQEQLTPFASQTDGVSHRPTNLFPVIREKGSDCIFLSALEFEQLSNNSPPLPLNNLGDRYLWLSHDQADFNLRLTNPMLNCTKYTIEGDVHYGGNSSCSSDSDILIDIMFHDDYSDLLVSPNNASYSIQIPIGNGSDGTGWIHFKKDFFFQSNNSADILTLGTNFSDFCTVSAIRFDNLVLYESASTMELAYNIENCEINLEVLNPGSLEVFMAEDNTPIYSNENSLAYNWISSNGYSSDSEDISPDISGDYTVTIEIDEIAGCPSFELTVPFNPITATVIGYYPNNCYNLADGSIGYQINNGSGNYNFEWQSELEFNVISEGIGLTSTAIIQAECGEYLLTISDLETGCVLNENPVIECTPTINPLDPNIMINNASCPGLCDGYGNYITAYNNQGIPIDFLSIVSSENTSVNNFCGNGSYSVQIEYSSNCYSPPFEIYIGTDSEVCCPAEGLASEINHSASCQMLPQSPIQFSNSTTTVNAEFLWNFGDGQTSDEQNPIHIYTIAGSYTVTLTINTPGCPSVSVSELIVINPFQYTSTINVTTQTLANTYASQWNNGTQSFGQDIVFGQFTGNSSPPVINITISNATFNLGPNVNIVIHENASITFINCVFTSCSTWNGFDVKSNGNDANIGVAGKLSFDPSGTTNSEIEYAEVAIETTDSRPDANYIPTGYLKAGYINCYRTIFRNNKTAIYFRNAKTQVYQAIPSFRRCTFVVNDDMLARFTDNSGEYDQFKQHVKYSRALRYNFAGCAFKNEMSANANVGQWKNRGIGIVTSGSYFTVKEQPTIMYGQYYSGLFQGLNVGISGGKSSSTITVSRQNFRKNHIGIYLPASQGSRIYTNTFKIGESTGISYLDDQEYYGTFPGVGNTWGLSEPEDNFTSYEGLIIYKGDLIEIAENTFTGFPQASGGIPDAYARIGTRIRATNTEEMVVRKNSYTRLTYGNLANSDNAGGTNTSGLRYICNTNSQNWQDFTNTDFLGTYTPAAVIGDVQKEPAGTYPDLNPNIDWPTGNTFSVDNSSNYTHFRNEGDEITEYWRYNSANQIPTDYLGIGSQIALSTPHSCPAKYTNPVILHSSTIISGMIATGNTAKLDADQYRYLYLLLVDGGDTEGLQQYVENTWGAQVWATREELLDISPFVSEVVMRSVLDNTSTYPHALAFEILAANPDLLGDPKLVAYLSAKADPMPQFMIDLLLATDPGATEKTNMQKTLAVKRTGHIRQVSEAL